jgi:hypothetical protein
MDSLLAGEEDGSMTRRRGVFSARGARLRMQGKRCAETAVQLTLRHENKNPLLGLHVDILKVPRSRRFENLSSREFRGWEISEGEF